MLSSHIIQNLQLSIKFIISVENMFAFNTDPDVMTVFPVFGLNVELTSQSLFDQAKLHSI